MKDFLNNIWTMIQNLFSPENIESIKNFLMSFTLKEYMVILVIYLILLWIGLVAFVFKDITNRTNNIFIQIVSLFLVTFCTPLWFPLYFIIRPWKTLLEQYYTEDDIEEVDEITGEIKDLYCEKCWQHLSAAHLYCPHCWTNQEKPCLKCKNQIRTDWDICPFCWVDQEKYAELLAKAEALKEKVEEVKVEEKVETKVESEEEVKEETK